MSRKVALLALVCLLTTNFTVADTPHLVKDINGVATPLSSAPVALGRLGNAELFQTDLSTRASSGSALVKSDGTVAGTVILKTFTNAKAVKPAVTIGTRVFFGVEDIAPSVTQPGQGPQLWVTDGTADGTLQISSFQPSPGIALQLLAVFGNSLLLAHYAEPPNYDLYVSDGTAAGTNRIASATGYGGNTNTIDFAVVGNRIYFVADSDDVAHRAELWKSDGTAVGTHKVTTISALDPSMAVHGLRALNDSVVFFSRSNTYGSELTRVDASDAVTVIDLAPGTVSGSYGSNPNAVMDGHVYFAGSTDGANYELWRSDGTPAGTTLVKDIDGGPTPSLDLGLADIVPAGGRLVFAANDGSGVKLWGTDGTAAGTVALTPVVYLARDAFSYLQDNGDSVKYEYIPAYLGSTQTTIITDGTPAGTAFPPATIGGNPNAILRATGDSGHEYLSFLTENQTNAAQEYWVYKFAPPNQFTPVRHTANPMGNGAFTMLNGKLLFDSFDAASGQELWGSDDGGTQLLVDFRPQVTTDYSSPQWLTDWNGKLAFTANDGVHGNELWLSDGTTAGTRMLADINAGAGASGPTYLYVWKGALYFFAFDGTASRFMRMTAPDATPEVLATVSAPNSFINQTGPERPHCAPWPAPLLDRLLFSAKTAQAGTELWSTDGTAAGTGMLADINTNPYYLNGLAMGSQPCYFTVFKNRAYFSANASASDVSASLWLTDGTQAGTTQFADLSNPAGFVVYKNELYFRANDLTTAVGNQTWRTDGTSAGTRPLVPATGAADTFSSVPEGISNDKLILLVPTSPPTVTYSLWATDSTASGTVRLEHTTLHGLLVLRDRLYFTNDAGGDEEPWASDGTPAGTHRLADLDSAGSSHPMSYVNFNGVTVIATRDASGPHLWRTDGTEAGTVQVARLPLDPLFPSFSSYAVSGQNLFFVGYDEFTDGELYVLSNDAPVAVADSAIAANGQAATINVLANDADADGSLDASSTRVVQGPAHGKAAVGANGSVTYTPTSGYSGTDTFTYTVADNQGSTSGAATVTVSVTGAPPPPVDGGGSVTGSGSKDGGGALSWYDLVALAALTLFRIPGLKKART